MQPDTALTLPAKALEQKAPPGVERCAARARRWLAALLASPERASSAPATARPVQRRKGAARR